MSGVTNQQTVVEAGKEIARLKANYLEFLTPIIVRLTESGTYPSVAELLECQNRGNAYFNYSEHFVGDSGLLGAHMNGLWVVGFAEDCAAILESYILHANFIRSYKHVLGGKAVELSEFAFANMQRMVKEYLPIQVAKKLKILSKAIIYLPKDSKWLHLETLHRYPLGKSSRVWRSELSA